MAKRHRKSKNDSLVERVLSNIEKNTEYLHKILAKATKDAVELQSRANQVIRETSKLRGFCRFNFFPEMLLVGRIAPEHDIIDLVLKHFSFRFPKFVIAIFVGDKAYIATYRKDISFNYEKEGTIWVAKITEKFIHELRQTISEQINEKLDLGQWDYNYWEKFYESQYIPTRKNIKQALRSMPKKYFEKAALSYEKKRIEEEKIGAGKNKSLLDYR